MHLGYRGANFHGWQIQPDAESVQSVLESALTTVLRRPTPITGAGRTDAGVNARMMIAHFDTPEDIDMRRFIRAINSLAGPGIAVYDIFPVAPDAHARFDATERTYRYFAHTRKDPFACGLSWQCSPELDFKAMNTAADLMLGRRDFTSFSKLHTDVRTNICDLRRARWHRMDATHWFFEISADRFLRNMVRAIVGTLVEVGRHKLAPEGILDILDKKDRCAAGTSMPAGPLFLWEIRYTYWNEEFMHAQDLIP